MAANVPSSDATLRQRRPAAPPPLPPARGPPPPLPLDLVESVLALLPAGDLLSAAAVSPSWRRAALSSPRLRPPSLLLHTHTIHHHLNSAVITTSALEPGSCSWLHLPAVPSPPFPLRSSASDTLLFTLSSSHLSFSSDPLRLRWTHLPAPTLSRIDPVVALVGPLLVAAGGVHVFEGDPHAVEVFDGAWRPACPMPDAFKRSASAYYLSAAVAGGRLHVVFRRNGLSSSLDPAAGTWSEPVDLLVSLDTRPFAVAIAAAGDLLLVAGVTGQPAAVTGVRLWTVGGEAGPVEIGRMPEDMVERFAMGRRRDSAAGVTEVEVRASDPGGYVYVYNTAEMEEVYTFRVGRDGGFWGHVDTGIERGSSRLRSKTVLATCSAVSIDELREALRRAPAPGQATNHTA